MENTISNNDEIFLLALSGEYTGPLPTPLTRPQKIMMAILNNGAGGGGVISPEAVGAAMEEYVGDNPDFWEGIPDGAVTRAMLADELPEQIRDETLREISAEEVNTIFDSVFHNN